MNQRIPIKFIGIDRPSASDETLIEPVQSEIRVVQPVLPSFVTSGLLSFTLLECEQARAVWPGEVNEEDG